MFRWACPPAGFANRHCCTGHWASAGAFETLDAVKNFTPELFALVAPDLVHFEKFLETLPGCSDPLVGAQMRLLFTRCQRSYDKAPKRLRPRPLCELEDGQRMS